MKIETFLHTIYAKINSKWFKDLGIRHVTIKLLDILPPSQRNEGKLILGVTGALPSTEFHKNLEHLPDTV